ncbi:MULTISPECIES: hypothetical protein [unclassified Microcoleus]|uniref:hypothetical protein n=1 Tax=unclassified Microcoleus TaxID=2642155 RepID=UPI002FD524AE
MGWKVRSDKLELVNARVQTRGGRQQVRWQVARYKIEQGLALSNQTLEDGLDETDLQYLAQHDVLIGDAANLMLEAMPELKSQKFQLAAIKDYFIPYYSLSIENFLNDYLKIKDNSHGTWTKFLNGETAIEYEAFNTICNVLDLDCHRIGTDTREMPDWKKLEILLWQLNHKTQIQSFQALARKSQNLVCLKFPQVSEDRIPIFWLLKTLIQPLDDSIQKAAIDFNSPIYSDSRDRLNTIIQGLGLPNKLYRNQNPNAIAKEIHRKMLKNNKTIVLLFFTQNRQNLTELYELFNLLYEPLLNQFSQQQTNQKLLMVWIDSQPSSQGDSDALDGEGDNDPYHEIPVTSRFHNSDLIHWTNLEKVQLFINRTINDDLSNCQFMDKISEFIWSESQPGQPEVLLKSVYSLCNLKWETHQGSWRKI